MKSRCYVKQSTIPNIGMGLFANCNIKKGETICSYTGKIKNRNDANVGNVRSNIYFDDGYRLLCHPDDPASFANDAIRFPTKKRDLFNILHGGDPFYIFHKNKQINAHIFIITHRHKALLIAENDIAQDEEVFVHYGFNYWFVQEKKNMIIELCNTSPRFVTTEQLYKSKSFEKYTKLFYDTKSIDFDNDERTVILRSSNDTKITMPIVDVRSDQELYKINIDTGKVEQISIDEYNQRDPLAHTISNF